LQYASDHALWYEFLRDATVALQVDGEQQSHSFRRDHAAVAAAAAAAAAEGSSSTLKGRRISVAEDGIEEE
jgi:hypothetical protein